MDFTKEMLEKAKSAKSAEELMELAKAEGMELTAEEAEKHFAELHRSGELADEELDNVSGGWCYKSGDDPRFTVGQRVYFYENDADDEKKYGVITQSFPKNKQFANQFVYAIWPDNGSGTYTLAEEHIHEAEEGK